VWLRPLSSAELMTLVVDSEAVLDELEPMRLAGLLEGVVVLGDRWRELRDALGDVHCVAPGIRGGVRIRDGIWVVVARQLRRQASAVNRLDGDGELVALYRRAVEEARHLLVYGVDESTLPLSLRSEDDQLRQEIARLRRHLTLEQEHILNASLHRGAAGVHSEDEGERWRAFIDVGGVLVEPDQRLHPAVVDELKDLFVPLLSGQAGRHQAALLLGLVAEAMGNGSRSALDEVEHKLHRNLRIIGGDFTSGDWPGIFEEAQLSARICLALVGARVGFANDDVALELVPAVRDSVRRALAGEQAGYEAAMSHALDLARSGS
jgi:hypothetical protein